MYYYFQKSFSVQTENEDDPLKKNSPHVPWSWLLSFTVPCCGGTAHKKPQHSLGTTETTVLSNSFILQEYYCNSCILQGEKLLINNLKNSLPTYAVTIALRYLGRRTSACPSIVKDEIGEDM